MADSPEMSSLASSVQRNPRRQAASIGELFAALSTQITSLVRGEIELTKTKASQFVSKMALGAGLLAGAAVFALFLLGWILHSVELALALVLPAWAASLIVVAILLLVVLVLAFLGKRELDKAKNSTPNPKAGVDASIAAVKKGLHND